MSITASPPSAGPQDGADPDRRRLRALLSGAALLPSDTSVRYAVLAGMVLATTSIIYTRLWLDRLGPDSPYQGCSAELTQLGNVWQIAEPLPAYRPIMERIAGCLRNDAAAASSWAMVGIVVVAAAAVAGYLALPRWRIRRRGLRPLGPEAPEGLVAHLDTLATRAGLTRAPTFWLDPYALDQAHAFGTQRHCHVPLHPAAVGDFADPARRGRFDAVVLHELAHVRNRDIRYTYLTQTTWWSFLLLAVVPYLVFRLLPLGFGDADGWWPAPMHPETAQRQVFLSVAVLIVVVLLTRQSILRVRETYADVTSAAIGDPDQLRQLAQEQGQRSRWWWLSSHPPARQRARLLLDPTRLPATGIVVAAGAGFAVALLQSSANGLLVQLVLRFFGDPTAFFMAYPTLSLLTHFTGALLLAGIAAVIGWHAVLRQQLLPGVRRPWLAPPVLAGALAAGVLAGEPFAIYHGSVGSWGLFDSVGATGWARWISAGALVGMMLVVVLWVRQAAQVFTGMVDRTPRWGVLLTTLVAAIALYPYHVSWSGMHDSPLMATVVDFLIVNPDLAWTAEWSPPARSWATRASLPMVAIAAIPGSALLLAAPSVAVTVLALLRPPAGPPRWWQTAGLGASGTRPARPRRPRLGRAVWTGIGGTAAFLAAATLLAVLVRARGGPADGVNIVGAGTYLQLVTGYLIAGSAAVTALVAGLVVGSVGRFPLALLAATLATSGGVLLSAVPIIAGICGTGRSVECLPIIGRSIMVTTMFGAPWAILLGCVGALLATGLAAAVGALRKRRTMPEDDPADARPVASRPVRALYGTILVTLLLAPLAVGAWLLVRLAT
ncbi:M48 family metalloprotease [Micromonospora sp. LOL_013]|uniref:M48 family metalloprotease n=1 Tax=Micromonospora sp. LOL_013 TaxID=3345414 RepID=UPI003A8978BF